MKRIVSVAIAVLVILMVALVASAATNPSTNVQNGSILRYGDTAGVPVIDSDFDTDLESGEVRLSQQVITDNGEGSFDVEVKVQSGSQIKVASDEAIVFVLDDSGSISATQWNQMISACASFVEAYPAEANVQFGIVMFDTSARIISHLTNNRAQVASLLRTTTRRALNTNTTDGLIKAKEVLDRYTVIDGAKTAIVITDGASNVNVPGVTLQQAADALKNSGTTIYAIGVGGYNLSELQRIATSAPNLQTIFALTNFSQLADSLMNIIRKSVSIGMGPDIDFVSVISGSNYYLSGNNDTLNWDPIPPDSNPTEVCILVYRIQMKQSAFDQGFKSVSTTAILGYTDANKIQRTENFDIPKVQMVSAVTVTFIDWDGTVLDTQSVKIGSGAIVPDDPARTGYTFIGWYDGDIEFDFDTPIIEDITLIAKWELTPITVLRITDKQGVVSASMVTLQCNTSAQFDVVVNTDALPVGIVWSTSNAAFATVSSTGLVTTKALAGTAVLTATAPNGVTHSIVLRII